MPGDAKDGASYFVEKLARYYKSLGHHVEVFTLAKPEKLAFLGTPTPWKMYQQEHDGINYNIFCRPWGLLYTNPKNPLQSVRDERTERMWRELLNKNGGWDTIHFNDINPLSLIEIAKEAGVHVRYSFHNFFLLFPIEHLFSYSKYKENPYQDLTLYDHTGASAVEQYKALGTLGTISEAEEREIERQFDERLQYGRYLLREVIDEVLGAAPPYTVFVREVFECAFPHVIQTDFALTSPNGSLLDKTLIKTFENKLRVAKHSCEKFTQKYQRGGKKIFGVYSNVTVYKGHHLIIHELNQLADLAGEFEVRFYGHTDYDKGYVAFLQQLIDSSDFLKQHVRLMGGYQREALHAITEDTIASIGCSATSIGSAGGIYESLLEGNLPLFVEDYTMKRGLRLMDEHTNPSDLRTRRLTFDFNKSGDLARKLRLIITEEEDLLEWFDKSIQMYITGGTVEPDFKSVWQC